MKLKKSVIITVVMLIMVLSSCNSTKSYNEYLNIEISEMIEEEIGGISQSILVRGESKDNPILLFLHGGPGGSEMPFNFKFNRDLEMDFIVANWDQRGTGKSYNRNIPEESMNINQMVDDAYEVVQLLLDRYGKEKVYVVGHSWGSLLGVYLVQKYPELFHAYVGIGQVVDLEENEIISLNFVREQAKKENNKKAIRQLEAIPDNYWEHKNWFKMLRTQRKWLNEYGGALYELDNNDVLFDNYMGPYHNFSDLIFGLIPGMIFSIETMWTELMSVDLRQTHHSFDIPVYLFVGRHDYNTPFELAVEYFDLLEAPKKELYWFEKSAHSPNIEEPKKFYKLLTEEVLINN